MTMTGLFHLTLLPTTDEREFEKQLTTVAFKNTAVLQLTRTTTDFDHQLWKKRGPLRQYVWSATVHLMTDADYDFAGNVEKVRDVCAGQAVITDVEVFENVASK